MPPPLRQTRTLTTRQRPVPVPLPGPKSRPPPVPLPGPPLPSGVMTTLGPLLPPLLPLPPRLPPPPPPPPWAEAPAPMTREKPSRLAKNTDLLIFVISITRTCGTRARTTYFGVTARLPGSQPKTLRLSVSDSSGFSPWPCLCCFQRDRGNQPAWSFGWWSKWSLGRWSKAQWSKWSWWCS